MKIKFGAAVGAALFFLGLTGQVSDAAAQSATAQATAAPTAPSPYVRTAPQGAPNVVLVMLDDVGFGAMSTFGGYSQTPAFSGLAKDGLRFNRFHTSAICSPTRAALMTGRNPHAVGIGAVMNGADARPGYSGFRGPETATVAEILRENGYATGAFGKWHQTPDWEASQSGPFDRWPTGEGFEKFYGFQGGETDQFEPTLFEGTTPIMRPAGDNYHFTEDLADQAVKWMRDVRATAPNKPFFLYFPTGGIHAPVQVPQDYADRYRGKFDQGWDKLREETFARGKRMGVIPANTKLTPRPDALPAWDSLSPEQKKFSARLMEAYAGFLAHTDEQVGKLVKELKDTGQYDNTLFIYIAGDNGASAEGGLQGSLNYLGALQGLPEPEAAKLARIDRIGAPDTYAHINSAWAWGSSAPFQWTKTIASHLGGTRNAMVMTWPKRIKDKGGLRSQFGYVSDVMPTILEAAGIKAPESVNGVKQKPITGVSLAYTFDNKKAPERHTTQYFEVFGNRSIYHNGWMASAFHGRLPWVGFDLNQKPLEEDVWELYDLRADFSQAENLAAKNPAKLKELQAVFMQEAEANQLLPLRGQSLSKAGLPDPSGGRDEATYYAGTRGVQENAIPRLANRSWSWEAKINTQSGAQGVIAALGGTESGLSMYIDAAQKPRFTYRLFDVKTIDLAGPALTAGDHVIRVNFDYNGPGFAKGGALTLFVNGKSVGTDTLPVSQPSMFNINETFDLGIDRGAPVGQYPKQPAPGFTLTGATIDSVTIRAK